MPVSERDFDVREFARSAVGCHRDSLVLADYDQRPLAPETLRCLRHLRELERGTMRYLRHVLVTPTHKDARVTAFLTTWAFEKFWVADAVAAILEHHRPEPEPPRPPRSGWAAAWRRARERFAPIGRSLVDNTLGEAVIAGHVAAGSVHEWLTRAAYQRLAQRDGHPELARTADLIAGIKSRHLAFFAAEAADRLRRSRLARRLTRSRLRRFRWPAPSADLPATEEAFFIGWVFGPEPALVDELDRRVQALPGLSKLTLVRSAVAASTRVRS